MNTLTLPCPVGKVSDGYHTFDELYEHRCSLFILLMDAHAQRSNPQTRTKNRAWRSQLHDDGTAIPDWFIAGIELETGMITYHLPMRFWSLLDHSPIATYARAPKWDGHTSQDVIKRMQLVFEKRMPIM